MKPLAAKPVGEAVTIDRGVLGEVFERLAEAVAAVERGNNRAGGVKLAWRCASAILTTGAAPAECPK